LNSKYFCANRKKGAKKVNIECCFIDNAGEEKAIALEKVRITPETLAVIADHNERKIYVFKGRETTIRQKFAGARSASMKRMELGYNIKHIEEEEGIDDFFKPILQFLGGLKESLEEEVKLPKSTPRREKHIIKAMMETAPVENASCEYIFTVKNYYEIDSFSKDDLSKGKFELRTPEELPEELFPAEEYLPRFIVVKNEIVGVELWKKSKSC
jgi:hypothetical protein